MKPAFKIKLNRFEFSALIMMYDYYIPLWESESDHELLLLEHAIEFFNRLKMAMNPNLKNFNFRLMPSQALAYMQWWQLIDTAEKEYGHVVICKTIATIDQVIKQLSTQKSRQ